MPSLSCGSLCLCARADQLEPPVRALYSPLRLPISNVFKGQTSLSSGLGVSGRVCSGVVQVGERLRVLPGDESAVVRREWPLIVVPSGWTDCST